MKSFGFRTHTEISMLLNLQWMKNPWQMNMLMNPQGSAGKEGESLKRFLVKNDIRPKIQQTFQCRLQLKYYVFLFYTTFCP